MFLVVWSRNEKEDIRDCWITADTYAEAMEVYESLLDQEDVYVASICNVIVSTDYEGIGYEQDG